MDVGIILAIRTLPARPAPLQQVYRDFVDDAVYAEQLGFDFAWTTEHHFAPDAWSPSQLPILANIAGRTSRLRLGTDVLLLPFHNPLRIAEDIATVDLLSDGRLDIAVGCGSVEDEFETFGIDSKERWGRMFEGLQVIRRSFEEDQFDHAGKYFQFPNVRMTTRPVQRPFPLWVAAAGPQTVRRTGLGGYHHVGGGQPQAFAGALEGRKLYEAALREAGHDPAKFNWFTYRQGHVSLSRAQAWDEAEEGLYHFRDFYTHRAPPGGGPRPAVPPRERLRDDPSSAQVPVGSPQDVLRILEPLRGADLTHFGFLFRHAGMPTSVVRRAMDLFASQVLPEVRTWGRPPVRANGAAVSSGAR
jgi:alkanesulfonate monooxygenase SsuD/methylene tetrahydromethanopterin reductase-like flavin-dependent oxidoreductase (luciferase family)